MARGADSCLKVAAGLQPPPGGLVFVWPGVQPPGPTRLNGERVSWQGTEMRIRQAPELAITPHQHQPPLIFIKHSDGKASSDSKLR